MKFCPECGKELKGAKNFCPECGGTLNTKKATGKKTKTTKDGYSKEDIESNKIMGVLSYLGILSLVPYFAAKDSKYAQYHAKQGVNLFIIALAYSIISTIIQAVVKVNKSVGFYYAYTVKVTPWYISVPLNALSIAFFVFAIIGIINACKGEQKELPIIGKFKIIK